MAVPGGAVAAAAASVAAGAFGYNRENYMYDAEMRWERFASAREYANQQADQYRDDIRNLAGLTIRKNTLWAVSSTLCMALCVALYCAGRLGLHGPSPPGWIMGLWLTNNAASFAFMAVTTFLALHASFRAHAASAHLLTRKVRVPVPTLNQLDQARVFASEFEQQSASDIFRIPFTSHNGAPKTDDAVYDNVEGEGSPSGHRGRRSSSAPPSRSKCSSWIRNEFEVTRAGSVPPSDLPADAAPEHFQLYASVQKEFYQHDIYARVGIFLGFVHYFQSLCFYGLGHINIEIRAFWVAYACTFVLAVLLALVLRFDIVPQPGRKQLLPKCEFLGPLAILPAAIGMSLEFRVEYDPTAIALCWVFVFISYIMQLIYSLRILEIVLPDEKFEGLGERLGASWLPEGWTKVPSSFYHVLYAVAPPNKLQPGQHDIVREVKEGGRGASGEVISDSTAAAAQNVDDNRRYHNVIPAAFSDVEAVNPWKLLAAICAVLPCMWVFLIFGTAIDVAIGEQALVTAPHWSRPPMTRLSITPHEVGTPLGGPWAAGAKPYLPEQLAWHEEREHEDEYNIGQPAPHHRRMSSAEVATQPLAGARLSEARLSEAMQELLELIPSAKEAPIQGVEQKLTWPTFFEPKLLACGADGQVAALTPRGFGAIVALKDGAAAEAFKLSGLSKAGPLVGASWGRHLVGDEGLLLVSKVGALFSCPGGRPAGGALWACAPASTRGLPHALPVAEGARLQAATAALLNGALHAAVVLEGQPDLVALFVQEADSWLPLGELRMPHGGSKKASLSFMGNDLLVSTGKGHMLRHNLLDGTVVASAFHDLAQNIEELAWHAACGFEGQGTRVAHLSLRKVSSMSPSMLGWQPSVVSMDIAAPAKPALFA